MACRPPNAHELDPDATYDYDRPFAALQGLAKLHHSEVAALLVEKLPSPTESVDGDDLLLLRNSSPCPVVT